MFVKNILDEFFINNKFSFLFYLITLIINYSFEFVAIPVIIGLLLNCINKTRLNFNFSMDIGNTFKKNIIYNIILLICICYFINIVIIHIINYSYNKLYSNLFSFIRIKLNKNLLDNKKINFKEIEVCKDLVSLDITSSFITTYIDNILSEIIPLGVFTVILFGFLFYCGKDLFIIFLISILCITLYIIYKKKEIVEISRNKEFVYLEMINKSENSFSNLSNILINNTGEYEINKNNKLTSEYERLLVKTYEIINNTVFIVRCIFVFFLFILLYYIFKNFKEKKIKIVNLIIILFVLTNYINFFRSKIYKIVVNYKNLGIIEVNKKNFNMIINNKLATNNYKIKLGKIEFRNIQFKYTDKLIFNNLNLIIQPKEKLAIIGKSGSGKSTLIKLLLRFYPIESGNILVDNIQIDKYNLDHLRQNIYYINQNTNLFNESVYYNIAYGLNNNDLNNSVNNRIDTFLKNYDLYNIFSNLEGGLNSISGPNGSNLSLGMQKIVLLVRGLLAVQDKNSKVVVFDEPLTALDKKSRVKVIKMIMKECSEKTLIVITHDHEIIPHVDRVVNLKDL